MGQFKSGGVTIIMPSGESIQTGDGKSAQIHINSSAFFKKCVLGGDIGFAESYMDGDWTTPDLRQIFNWIIGNIESSGVLSGSSSKFFGINFMSMANKLGHILRENTLSGSKKNISYHYDLGNDFYALMLDSSMTYSCGLFQGVDLNDPSALYHAQMKKYEQLCQDLDLKSTDHILEIGCGWGGFAEYAASKFGCKITGVTISNEQLKYANERIKKAGLDHLINFQFIDYREIQGKFDKVISIEMIEAVGDKFLPTYFQTINNRLKSDGIAVIQAITSPDSRYEEFKKGTDFIQKHVFPGTLLPSIRAITNACTETKLHLYNLRDIGLDYATTLNIWHERFVKNWDKIEPLGFDDVFKRKWEYYLIYCEVAFATRNISDVQITLIKPNNQTYKMT